MVKWYLKRIVCSYKRALKNVKIKHNTNCDQYLYPDEIRMKIRNAEFKEWLDSVVESQYVASVSSAINYGAKDDKRK